MAYTSSRHHHSLVNWHRDVISTQKKKSHFLPLVSLQQIAGAHAALPICRSVCAYFFSSSGIVYNVC